MSLEPGEGGRPSPFCDFSLGRLDGLDSACEIQAPVGTDPPSRIWSILMADNEPDADGRTADCTENAGILTDLQLEFLERHCNIENVFTKGVYENTFRSNAHSVDFKGTDTDPARLVLDLGCRRNVGGPKWHAKMRQKLARLGLQPERLKRLKSFDLVTTALRNQFVHGDTRLASRVIIVISILLKSSIIVQV